MSEYDAVAIADVKELKNIKGRILAVDFRCDFNAGCTVII